MQLREKSKNQENVLGMRVGLFDSSCRFWNNRLILADNMGLYCLELSALKKKQHSECVCVCVCVYVCEREREREREKGGRGKRGSVYRFVFSQYSVLNRTSLYSCLLIFTTKRLSIFDMFSLSCLKLRESKRIWDN